ncbi:hypothetical protein XELAEV_18015779mg [Xenopus laevis]|uniref:Uncharacterized protein n=1 Tax=Xenopus laevis TaxID=8355 RepID=A0A974HW92_XENLA|nr:hypothetical protein XELAEV_18015779mg [Xenopus laevis]
MPAIIPAGENARFGTMKHESSVLRSCILKLRFCSSRHFDKEAPSKTIGTEDLYLLDISSSTHLSHGVIG